jgi:uridine phosphorylase
MMNKTWIVMNDLEEAFSEITAFNFMLNQLQEAVDSSDAASISNVTASLNAFYPVYCDNWDKKFKEAWNHVAKDNS